MKDSQDKVVCIFLLSMIDVTRLNKTVKEMSAVGDWSFTWSFRYCWGTVWQTSRGTVLQTSCGTVWQTSHRTVWQTSRGTVWQTSCGTVWQTSRGTVPKFRLLTGQCNRHFVMWYCALSTKQLYTGTTTLTRNNIHTIIKILFNLQSLQLLF